MSDAKYRLVDKTEQIRYSSKRMIAGVEPGLSLGSF